MCEEVTARADAISILSIGMLLVTFCATNRGQRSWVKAISQGRALTEDLSQPHLR